MANIPLLDWILNLLRDDHARAAFDRDPAAAFRAAGFDGNCSDQIDEVRRSLVDHACVASSGDDEGNDRGWDRGWDHDDRDREQHEHHDHVVRVKDILRYLCLNKSTT
jgi:hypothetical protein